MCFFFFFFFKRTGVCKVVSFCKAVRLPWADSVREPEFPEPGLAFGKRIFIFIAFL